MFGRLITAAVTAMLMTVTAAHSQPIATSLNQRSIHIVVPFAAGGTTDLTARTLAHALSQSLPHPVVVENRPGAFATIGANHVLSQRSDGYTLLIGANGMTANHHFSSTTTESVLSRFDPITILIENAMVMMVANNVPASNGEEFVRLIRSNPGRFDYATIGGGGVVAMAASLFLRSIEGDMQPIPYGGGAPAAHDLFAGRIALMFDSTIVGLPHHRAGSARAFAVTSPTRSRLAPLVPTLREIGVDAEMNTWQALFVSQNTPAHIQEELNRVITTVLSRPHTRQLFLDLGADQVVGGSLQQSRSVILAETELWNSIFGKN